MSSPVAAMILLVIGVTLAAAVLLFAGYRWGNFAAHQVRQCNSERWKAYVVALLPPAAFSMAFHFDRTLSPMAGQAFWAMAAPAVIGACLGSRGETED